MLSTYKIAALTGIDRQRITRLLRTTGITVKPSGRRPARRTAEDERLDQIMARLYQVHRIPPGQIAELAGVPQYAVTSRLRARGVPIRSRGRTDQTVAAPDDLAALYLQAEMSADEADRLLGLSRSLVPRTAHDQGLPASIGRASPSRGPSEIELLAALYADPQVVRALDRHGVPVVALTGPIWKRFPAPQPLTVGLVTDLYAGCGLSTHHIELLTGRPAAAAATLLRTSGVRLRPAGGRSPFMRRWRPGRE
jgi:predicted HTH domain antitoxin